MHPHAEATGESTWRSTAFVNPVFAESFPDPFVLKHRGEYFAYCTGLADDGNVFGVIHSQDLVTWTRLDGAMTPLDPSPPFYWAPEVTYDNGKFYLYYSVGNETLMEIRVAVSDFPSGGFRDCGLRLTNEDFAIDAHVFIDEEGTKYLFYATDFLEHTHIGTGTVVDRMLDWFTLEGNPRRVTTAKYDWQVYDPARAEKGGVRWHTVEGPAVIKHKGKYFEMFSGGNWKNTTYGVSFATTDDIHAADEWSQFSDGEKVFPILRTIPDRIVGPGHNCIVRGPNGRERYCVYHRWTEDGRVMAIDRMDFAGDRIFVVGATDSPQPGPFQPSARDLWNTAGRRGDWELTNDEVTSSDEAISELKLEQPPASFLCEFALRFAGGPKPDGTFALAFTSGKGKLELTLHPLSNVARLTVPDDSPGLPSIFKLPEEIDWTAWHDIRIEVDHHRLSINVNGTGLAIKTCLANGLHDITIRVEHLAIAITSFSLTEGFEEMFVDEFPLEENGWTTSGNGSHCLKGGEILMQSDGRYILRKGGSFNSSEFAANFRLPDEKARARYGLILTAGGDEFPFEVDPEHRAIVIADTAPIPLPDNIDLSRFHQLRALKIGGQVLCYLDDALLGEFRFRMTATSTSIFCDLGTVAVEMIRLTRL